MGKVFTSELVKQIDLENKLVDLAKNQLLTSGGQGVDDSSSGFYDEQSSLLSQKFQGKMINMDFPVKGNFDKLKEPIMFLDRMTVPGYTVKYGYGIKMYEGNKPAMVGGLVYFRNDFQKRHPKINFPAFLKYVEVCFVRSGIKFYMNYSSFSHYLREYQINVPLSVRYSLRMFFDVKFCENGESLLDRYEQFQQAHGFTSVNNAIDSRKWHPLHPPLNLPFIV